MYPKVSGEFETLHAVLAGASLARYGDGEFNLADGRKCVSQCADANLAKELREILVSKHRECLIGVPTMDRKGPKVKNWSSYAARYALLMSPKKAYYSAFITRPDSAPWINTPEFFDAIESLWRGQEITLVGNGIRSLTPSKLQSAKRVDFVECSYKDSYAQIEDLYRRTVALANHRAILCCGPTATCLAYRLSRAGFHAIDLGHIGLNGFWRRYDKDFSK